MAFVYDIRDKDFNPRSREGSDRTFAYKEVTVGAFQSTLPRRERR